MVKLVIWPTSGKWKDPFSYAVHPDGRPGDIWAIFQTKEMAELFITAWNAFKVDPQEEEIKPIF